MSAQMADEVTVNLYVTPREFCETPEHIRGDVAVLVQAFCQEFALPHFQHFNKHCEVEIITPPEDSVQAGSISVDGLQYLPFPSSPTSSCIQCSAQDPCLFEAPTNTKVDCMPSAAICQVKELVEVHPPLKVIEQTPPTTELPAHSTSMFLMNPIIFGPTLISISPNTDAVLDHFKINDKVLPQL
ncbi:hypothetical protein BKA83DRAFT_4486271 [Pisolithus microcarpus]|nr:hypothetical protein BKA83DRAFT_4486271 [Pisolithus microcarpus]